MSGNISFYTTTNSNEHILLSMKSFACLNKSCGLANLVNTIRLDVDYNIISLAHSDYDAYGCCPSFFYTYKLKSSSNSDEY